MKNFNNLDGYYSNNHSGPILSSRRAFISGVSPKDIPKRTPEWYTMAGDKLTIVIKSLVPLVTHEHYKVRKELAVLCYRIISECNA